MSPSQYGNKLPEAAGAGSPGGAGYGLNPGILKVQLELYTIVITQITDH
jgi:hypothetical protein